MVLMAGFLALILATLLVVGCSDSASLEGALGADAKPDAEVAAATAETTVGAGSSVAEADGLASPPFGADT